jgi:hypothetical protein
MTLSLVSPVKKKHKKHRDTLKSVCAGLPYGLKGYHLTVNLELVKTTESANE